MKKPKTTFKNIMLVDDNEIDNFINQKIVEGISFSEHVFIYNNGQSAIEYLKNLQNNFEFNEDLYPEYIFLDINMPIMDGHQFIEEFESLDSKIKDNCKIAVLTSSLNPIDRNLVSKSKRVVSFINKPLTEESLNALL